MQVMQKLIARPLKKVRILYLQVAKLALLLIYEAFMRWVILSTIRVT